MASKRKRKRRQRRLLLLGAGLLCLILAGSLYLFYRISLRPADPSASPQTITIEEGQTLSQVLENLQEEDLIRSETVASLYARLHGLDASYAGSFEISAEMSTPEILDYINDPVNILSPYEIITVPEGYWARQIADVLHEHFPQYAARDFLDLWNDESYLLTLSQTYPFLHPDEIPDDVRIKLEGYLFPDTYYFDKDASMEEITDMFLDGFNTVYQANLSQIEKSAYDIEEIVTLASIVQFEAGTPDQMDEIAGVFENRLQAGMRLESSVTVCYALDEAFTDANACEVNYDLDSPYNSYLNDGLPPGPILNPGADAIEAVLNPARHDYYFFVADIHGNGDVYYASTYEEHLENMERLNLFLD